MKILVAALAAVCVSTVVAQPAPKVLRVAYNTAESGFDPARINDIYSRTVTPHIFEGLYQYDHLARPAKIKPLTAQGMPEASSDFRTWTVKLQPGIYFADDPAFKGQRRELVAQDYVYSFKRFADPAVVSPVWAFLETFKLLGLSELRKEALEKKKRFDYERDIPGVRAVDRYTIQFKIAEPRPRFIQLLAGGDLFGAVAREVVEHYEDRIVEHPVGTGPFRLKQWRRSSLIVLERNPHYRDVRYDAEPAPQDAEGQALLQRFRGRRLPMIDEVHISIIDEDQPRWLSFLNEQLDAIAGQYGAVPGEFVTTAMPNGKLAPNLAKRGIKAYRQVNADRTLTYFNMEDPTVGGNAPEKVALRRAIGLAIDLDREIRLLRRGQAIPSQSPLMPHTSGYDPDFKSENSDYDPARAKALLDLYGYVDRDGDDWRDMPDGSPLQLELATQPERFQREMAELWQKCMTDIGIRIRFTFGQWPEQLKAARAGKLMMWALGYSAAAPDGQGSLQQYHGVQAGGQNLARFRHAEMDTIYDRLSELPDGPEREALFLRAKQIAVAYIPYKGHVHRISTDMVHPWVIGFRRPLFWNDWWDMVDIDESKRPKKAQRQ